MIQIKNLTKIYRSKKKNKCKALDNINLILENKGLVFVLGKSGSGKSTLLNLLGGLDNITSGTIIVDGNDISNLKEKEYANYRNTEIGFVFQDYHLIEELTVKENILLSLNLRGIEDESKVSEALEKVDLKGYENRYPNELSGGERQRVAIARAIIKSPRIILADEPTGNLDTQTSKLIIETLKEVSGDCLIIIVSHNTLDAYKYGDRIIELANGKIIRDLSRNLDFKDELYVNEDIIYYPIDKVLEDKDIELINDNKTKKIIKNKDKFTETRNIEYSEENKEIINSNLSFKSVFRFCLKFLNSKYLKIVFSSFMSSIILTILLFSMNIVMFNGGEVLANELTLANEKAVILEKILPSEKQEQYDEVFRGKIDEDDINTFIESGYKGDIYEVYSHTTVITNMRNQAGEKKNIFSNSIYIQETVGLIIVDEVYLIEKFGKDNEVKYVAKLDSYYEAGVIITDYVADCILLNNPTYQKYLLKENKYDYLLGQYFAHDYKRTYINAIIDTGYKEKYKEIFNSSNIDLESLKENKELVTSFSNDVYTRLGMTYTLNKNFLEDYPKYETNDYFFFYKAFYDDKELSEILGSFAFLDKNGKLKDNQVTMSYQKYNDIFGTSYNMFNAYTFQSHTCRIRFTYFNAFDEEFYFDEEVEIVGFHQTNNGITMSETLYRKGYSNQIYPFALLFDGVEGIDNVINIYEDKNYDMNSLVVESLYTMTKAVEVFVPIFELVAIALCVGVIFILVNFSSKMIKDKYHEIGVMKALGAKNSSIVNIFGAQILLISILTIILTLIGYYVFIDFANVVLIESLQALASSYTLLDLTFLYFRFDIALIGIGLIIALSIVSLLLPMVRIKNIKPVKIIKAKE